MKLSLNRRPIDHAPQPSDAPCAPRTGPWLRHLHFTGSPDVSAAAGFFFASIGPPLQVGPCPSEATLRHSRGVTRKFRPECAAPLGSVHVRQRALTETARIGFGAKSKNSKPSPAPWTALVELEKQFAQLSVFQ